MFRCLVLLFAVTASALHSPSSEEFTPIDDENNGADESDDDVDDDLEDDDDDLDDDVDSDESLAEIAADVDDDGDDDVWDDDDDDLDDDDVDEDDLDALVEENEDVDDDDDDDDDGDDDDESDDAEDDDYDDDVDDDVDDDDASTNNHDVDKVEEKTPTMVAEADEEREESDEFEFHADMPLQKGPTDQASVFAKAKAAGKPAMVLATKSWCPHCKDLAESMNADPAMKTLMAKFVAFHAPDAAGEAWHGEIGYVPRAFFYNKDGQQIDVHSPYAQYPYFFDSSQVLQAGMKKALSQA